VIENIIKMPTVNPNTFKSKFKDNSYNNNEAKRPSMIMKMASV
jgi:hypothetical protein